MNRSGIALDDHESEEQRRWRVQSLRDPAAGRAPVDLAGRSAAESLDWYRLILRIRLCESTIGDMVESGEAACPCHLTIGQEACAVGVAAALRPTDAVFGGHRAHGQFLAMGGSSESLLAEILGKETGCSGGFGGSMHLTSPENGLIGTVPIVAATVPIAVGAAWAAKLRGDGNVGVAFFGDGATEEGVFHESANLARMLGAPMLFVVENNLFASHLEIDQRQPFPSVGRYGPSHGLATLCVDGNDIAAVATATEELLTEVRLGRPALLELFTFRWRGHVGHREDLDVGVGRSEESVQQWRRLDPQTRLKAALINADYATEDDLRKIENEEKNELDLALLNAKAASEPSVETMHHIVYNKAAT